MKRCIIYSGYLYLVLAGLLVTGISGCYYDKEELLYPGSGICDTAAVKYSTTVVPIVSASCYSCHAGSFPSGGVKLDTYNDIRVHALSGRLYGAISHSNGFVPMPQSSPMLSSCKIQGIKRWIDDGAPNN
jgi:hypothetical protein